MTTTSVLPWQGLQSSKRNILHSQLHLWSDVISE